MTLLEKEASVPKGKSNQNESLATRAGEPRAGRWRLYVLAALATVGAICALVYAWYDHRYPTWKEEVRLPDGRRIVVTQKREHIEGYGTRRTWLTFSLAEMDGEQTWDERLQPTMIGVENGRVYVVGRPRGSQQFERYVYPRYVYVAFLWNGHDFSRVPFMSVPAHLRTKENVRWCLPGGRDSRIGFAKRVTASAPWCIWPSAGATENPFPRPQVVDLEVRMREAERWASQDGHRPSSE